MEKIRVLTHLHFCPFRRKAWGGGGATSTWRQEPDESNCHVGRGESRAQTAVKCEIEIVATWMSPFMQLSRSGGLGQASNGAEQVT